LANEGVVHLLNEARYLVWKCCHQLTKSVGQLVTVTFVHVFLENDKGLVLFSPEELPQFKAFLKM
jgi:hypothetical protein